MRFSGAGPGLKAVCWALALCALPVGGAQAAEQWVADEVLSQIYALRKEVAALREELGELRRDLSERDAGAKARAALPDVDFKALQMPHLGSTDAPLAIIEFSDFQCPYCKRFTTTTFTQIKRDWIDTGKVQYLVADYPLAFHSRARFAAIAAACAGRQDAYWPMRDRLFHDGKLQRADLLGAADQLKLSRAEFDACLDEPASNKLVDQGIALGQRLGVSGTPSFIIGRVRDGQLVAPVKLVGAQAYAAFNNTLSKY